MKIFIIPSWYASKKNGGACPFISEQVEALHNMGHEVIVLSIQMYPISSFFLRKETYVDVNDGSYIYYKEATFFYPGRFFQINERHFIRCLRHVYDEAEEKYGRPDVLYAHFSYPAGCAASVLSKERKIPLVVQEHWSYLNRKSIPVSMKKILIKTINSADVFIAVSVGLKNSIEQHIPESRGKITVVSNMINPCFEFKRKCEHNGYVFFSMGNLIPRKGFLELIEAFAHVFSEKPEIKLRIAGSGQQECNIRTLIKQKHLENQISLLGRLTRVETLNEYINCDCFVLASKGETFGLVYREALAVGRPIISTRHQGFSDENWDENYGWLVDIDNQEQLEAALNAAYEYQDFLGEERSKKCLQSCSYKVVMQRIEKILQTTVDGGNYK